MRLNVITNPSAALPPLYARWMRSLLRGPIPAETNATCDDCAMCDADAPQGNAQHFSPKVKCCSYLPRLSNFTIGRILLDTDTDSPPDLAPVHARLAGPETTPLGVSIREEYTLVYQAMPQRFGRSIDALCPHFQRDTRRCGIWRHRNAVCATWFCKHVRGNVGRMFWKSLLRLLLSIETSLEIWCVRQLDPGPKALAELFASENDAGRNSPGPGADRNKTWGRWLDKEAEFFKRCARLVERLSWPQVLELCGQQAQVYADVIIEHYRRLLDDSLPQSLRFGESVRVQTLTADVVDLVGYSTMDVIQIPRELFDALHLFDGRPTGRALKDICDQYNLDLQSDLVSGLVDFEILKAANGKDHR